MGMILLYMVCAIEETVKYWFVYSGIWNLKTTTEIRKHLLAFFIIVITAGINLCFFDINYSVTLIICGFLCMCLLMQSDWKTKILAFVPAYFVINFLDTTVMTIAGWIFNCNPLAVIEKGDAKVRLLYLFPSCILLGFVTFLNQNRKKCEVNSKKITRLQYMIISFGLFAAAMLTSFVTYMIFNDDAWKLYWFKNWFTVVAMESIVTLFLFILYMKELMAKQKVQNEMLFLYEKQNLLQNEYYQRLYEQTEELKRFRHDYHHHLYVLKELLHNKKYREAATYIRQLENKPEKHMDIVYSGNTVVDAVICGVLGNTEIQDIRFEYKGKLKKKIGIEDVDICTILGNVLENAVEECERYQGKRYIRMEIATYKSNLFITVCNSCRQNPDRRGKERRTEKKEKRHHGYGIQNMKAAAEKYNGGIQFKEEEGEFTVKIHLEERDIL